MAFEIVCGGGTAGKKIITVGGTSIVTAATFNYLNKRNYVMDV